MLAREVMTHPAVSVRTDTSIIEAAQLLSTMGFTALPVLDDDDRLVGIVSEADLIRRPLPPDPRRQPSWSRSPRGSAPRTVGEVMTTSVESLTPGADVADAARIMVDEGIRCLPIVDGSTVVGVLTRRDLLRFAVARSDSAMADDIVARLATLGGDPNRWTVTVRAAVADVADFCDSADDRAVAARLVGAVPGIVHADVHHLTPDPS